MKYGMFLSLVVVLSASAAMAEGIPSQSKLNSLGLSSMNVVSDQAGEEVRGKAFFKLTAVWQAAAGEKAVVNADGSGITSIVIDPAAFVAHDANSGTLIVEDGVPLTFTPLAVGSPLVVFNTADANHQQNIQVGTFNFTELSSSINRFVFAFQRGTATTPPPPPRPTF